MKNLIIWLNSIINKHKALKRWKRVVTVLAAIMTFVTTYALILPAITVEKDQTEEVSGMYLDQEDLDDMLLENALEPTSKDILADYTDEDVYAAETDAPTVANTLITSGSDYTVTLFYDETSGMPEGAVLTVTEISQDSDEYQIYLDETKKAMGLTEEETLPHYAARFFDIKIMDGNEEFKPENGVSVEITYAEPLAEKADAEVSAVHFADESAEAEVIEANTTEVQAGGAATVEFTAESFSVYGVIYTVDFYWEVDGSMYEFSLPGGESVSLSELVEVLGIADQAASVSPLSGEAAGAIVQHNIMVSEKTREFVADVKSVEFSSPSLVDVSTTESGDWVLTSMQPFESEEALTVTMKTGEVFIVKVTDAQISTDVLTADGSTFKVIVTINDDAQIPAGTKLIVGEIEPDTDEYIQLLGRTWQEINKDYFEQKDQIYEDYGPDEKASMRPINIDTARFFDISFVYRSEELEPKAPVQVDIQLADGLSSSADDPIIGVVHFPSMEASEEAALVDDRAGDAEPDSERINEKPVELIEQVGSVKGEAGTFVEFFYEQESFSQVGIYLGRPTYEAGITPMDPAIALPKLTAMKAGEPPEQLEEY